LEEGYICPVCPEGDEETVEHLFFGCSSSVARWFSLGVQWSGQGSIVQMVQQQKSQLQMPFFMEFFMIGAWCL
jgi:hypothetical protein